MVGLMKKERTLETLWLKDPYPNAIVSIDLDSGAASMETEFPQSQFAGRQKMFGGFEPGERELILLAEA